MKVYTVITVATNGTQGSALDVSKTAHTTIEAARKGLEDYTEVKTNLFEKTDDDGVVFTVLVVEQEVV
jgi:hypothetical protein